MARLSPKEIGVSGRFWAFESLRIYQHHLDSSHLGFSVTRARELERIIGPLQFQYRERTDMCNCSCQNGRSDAHFPGFSPRFHFSGNDRQLIHRYRCALTTLGGPP